MKLGRGPDEKALHRRSHCVAAVKCTKTILVGRVTLDRHIPCRVQGNQRRTMGKPKSRLSVILDLIKELPDMMSASERRVVMEKRM